MIEKCLTGIATRLESLRKEQNMELPVILGYDAGHVPVGMDLARLPHLLLGGCGGGGKTAFIRAMLYQLMVGMRSEEIRFVVCDPYCTEYPEMTASSYLALPIVHDAKRLLAALRWAEKEIKRRVKLMRKDKCRNIAEYNAKVTAGLVDGETLSYIVFSVDELSDYMAANGERIATSFSHMCACGHAAGLHFVLATKRPGAINILSESIKANLQGRIAFVCATEHDSRCVVGVGDATALKRHGEMLFRSGTGEIVRLQGWKIPDGMLASASTDRTTRINLKKGAPCEC